MKKIGIIVLLILSLFLISCNKEQKYTIYFDEAFSVVPYISFYSSNKFYKDNKEKIEEDLNKIYQDLDDMFNVNKEDSLISQVNANAGINSVNVGIEFIDVLACALEISEKVSDKYDISTYPIFKEWDFNNRYYNRTNQKYDIESIIDQNKINDLLELVNYKNVEFKFPSVYLTKLGMKIDLGSIVKGYASDKSLEYLLNLGLNNGIINIGGNIITFGHPTNKDYYNVGITEPFGSSYALYVEENETITCVTSGIYERYILGTDDKYYHHIIDPSTGYPIENELYSVTVLGSLSSMKADALSTAIFTLGLEKGLAYANQNNLEVVFITSDKKIYLSDSIDMNHVKFNEESEYSYARLN